MRLPDPARSRAVLIGTSQYQADRLDNLPAVTNNLKALQEALCDHSILGLPPQHCQVVENPTTRPAMVDPAYQAAQEATDTLLVYYAGHGITDTSGNLFLSLTESEPEPQRSYTAVEYDTLRAALLDSRAPRRVVILDCCFSGRALGVMSDPRGMILEQTDIAGTYVVAAAAENKAALALPGAIYTAFSTELIAILNDGIPGDEKLLTLDAIFDHIRNEMHAKSLPIPHRRERDDAGRLPLIKNRANISLSSAPPGYGAVTDVEIGTLFPDRKALSKARVHRSLQAGICGTSRAGGAESIVISGGYKDDRDFGDVILYTGHGGRDRNGHRQVDDQNPADPGNAALIKSLLTGLPVRVIRGWEAKTECSPSEGYSYDGLFVVKDYYSIIGQDGFRILQFRLELIDDGSSMSSVLGPENISSSGPLRSNNTPGRLAPNRWEKVSRGFYLDRSIAERVKVAHDYACQVCGTVLETPGGIRYADVVHIRGLGEPHKGPDVPENILCLCPNHRTLFEVGAITIEDNLQIVDEITRGIIDALQVSRAHRVSLEYLRYHRNLHRLSPSPAAQARREEEEGNNS